MSSGRSIDRNSCVNSPIKASRELVRSNSSKVCARRANSTGCSSFSHASRCRALCGSVGAPAPSGSLILLKRSLLAHSLCRNIIACKMPPGHHHGNSTPWCASERMDFSLGTKGERCMPDSSVSEPHESVTCAFCRIIRGEEKASMVFEDSISLAFLDRRPVFPGHCLLVPREHYETLADLPAPLVGLLFQNAQLLERPIEEGLQADGTFVAINNRVSQSVPHVHIHLVPRHKGDGLKGFFWPRQRYKDEATMLSVQATLRSAVAKIQAGE